MITTQEELEQLWHNKKVVLKKSLIWLLDFPYTKEYIITAALLDYEQDEVFDNVTIIALMATDYTLENKLWFTFYLNNIYLTEFLNNLEVIE